MSGSGKRLRHIEYGQRYNAARVKTKRFARFGPMVGAVGSVVSVALYNNRVISFETIVGGMFFSVGLIVSAMIVNEVCWKRWS
jgi:hypothetical protein